MAKEINSMGGGGSTNKPAVQALRRAINNGQAAYKPRSDVMQKVGKTPVGVQDAPLRGEPAPQSQSQSQSIAQGRKPKAPKSPQSRSITQRRS